MKMTTALTLLAALLVVIVAGGTLSQEAEDRSKEAPDKAQEAKEKTMRRVHDPIQVPGELLTKLHGADIKSLRLFAMNNGAMGQIPLQIDERLPSGEFIMDLGEGASPDKHNWKLDPQDYLLFCIRDTGGRAPRESWPSQDGIEIELDDPVDQGRSYCYLLLFEGKAPALLKDSVVSVEGMDPGVNPKSGIIFQGLTFDKESFLNNNEGKYYRTGFMKKLSIPPSAGGSGVNIIDRQKVRFSIELNLLDIKVDFNEQNLIGGVHARRAGPVRAYDIEWATLPLPLNLEGPRVYADYFVYDSFFITPLSLNIPFNPESIIKRLVVDFGYDFNNEAVGMRFYSPNCMDGVTIDGVMSEKELAMSKDWPDWFLITGPQGSFMYRMEIDEKVQEQSDLTLNYIDDRNQEFPPEDLPGSIGYAQSQIELKSIKKGTYCFTMYWYYPPNIYKPGGFDEQVLQDYLNMKDAPVIIRIGGKTARNQALSPMPLKP